MDIWKERLEMYKIPFGLSLVGIVLIIGGWFTTIPSKSKEFPKESQVSSAIKIIKIDISGEVIRPGVYELAEGSRTEDLINSAGGFTNQVNQDFIEKRLNLAQKLTDGVKIYIPKLGEQDVSLIASDGKSEIVSINQASVESLKSLPGVGDVTAKKIIDGRPYTNLSDLVDKKIISKTLFDKIESKISQ